MIKRGDIVVIKAAYRDYGDELYIWRAIDDEEKGRVSISPDIPGILINPVQTVTVEMLEDRTL